MENTKKIYITFDGADNMQARVWENKLSGKNPYGVSLIDLDSGKTVASFYYYARVTDAISKARKLVGLAESVYIPDQRSLKDQVYDLIALANKNKLYDAADYLTMVWNMGQEK